MFDQIWWTQTICRCLPGTSEHAQQPWYKVQAEKTGWLKDEGNYETSWNMIELTASPHPFGPFFAVANSMASTTSRWLLNSQAATAQEPILVAEQPANGAWDTQTWAANRAALMGRRKGVITTPVPLTMTPSGAKGVVCCWVGSTGTAHVARHVRQMEHAMRMFSFAASTWHTGWIWVVLTWCPLQGKGPYTEIPTATKKKWIDQVHLEKIH